LEFFQTKFSSAFSANIIPNKNYGFVKFHSKSDAKKAIEEMNGIAFLGKRLKVRESFQRNRNWDQNNHSDNRRRSK
jgi:RNA recognition motif-containing protein